MRAGVRPDTADGLTRLRCGRGDFERVIPAALTTATGRDEAAAAAVRELLEHGREVHGWWTASAA